MNVYQKRSTHVGTQLSARLRTQWWVFGLMLVFGPAAAWAQTGGFEVLHSFLPRENDGGAPYHGLIRGQDGGLYGMTWAGGTSNGGVVFRISADGGDYQLLHSFGSGSDGHSPEADLVQGRDGMLYGTTFWGGEYDFGIVFALGTNGAGYRVLHSFSNSPDGANPHAGLTQGFDGALYGTTYMGGVSNAGTIFRITPDGTDYSILHSFENVPDGSEPMAPLVQANDGALYGTTSSGGGSILGTVFAIQTNGAGYRILHHFPTPQADDGWSPEAGLIQGSDGALYGLTLMGGTKGSGTVFRMNTDGNGYSPLHSFTSQTDGGNPYHGSLVQGDGGVLYGMTSAGGQNLGGTIFRLSPNGSGFAVLRHFGQTDQDAKIPFAGLTQADNGVFYGMTWNGGAYGFGTVFRLSPAWLRLTIAFSAQGQPELTVTGYPGQTCQVQATTDFANWDTLSDLVLTDGSARFTDSSGASLPGRFYRAVAY